MGMAGGAYQSDMERARLRLQAAQIAQQGQAQAAQQEQANARLAEQARQADMADARANRELDIRERQADSKAVPAQRRSPIPTFSNADALTAARQAANDRRLMELEGQNATLGQFRQVVDTEQRQNAAKKAQGQSTMASLMKVAMANGGTAPMSALALAGRQFGFDNKTCAIGGAGFTQNGDWYVDFVQKDQNGRLSRKTSTMPFADLGRIYYSQAGIFDNADRAAWRKGMLDAQYSTQEVNTRAGLNATAIEGLDDEGLQRLDAGFVDPSGGGDWKRDLAIRKQQLAEAKFAQSLGQNRLDDAQKYALYHFKDFGNPREATQEDVDNGLAKKVGDPFMPTPKMQFDEAVQFYKDNMDAPKTPSDEWARALERQRGGGTGDGGTGQSQTVDPSMEARDFWPSGVRTAADAVAQPQTTATSGDNGGNKTGRQEPPNGQYRLKKDGISYHWGKSKNGKWGYFPDK